MKKFLKIGILTLATVLCLGMVYEDPDPPRPYGDISCSWPGRAELGKRHKPISDGMEMSVPNNTAVVLPYDVYIAGMVISASNIPGGYNAVAVNVNYDDRMAWGLKWTGETNQESYFEPKDIFFVEAGTPIAMTLVTGTGEDARPAPRNVRARLIYRIVE